MGGWDRGAPRIGLNPYFPARRGGRGSGRLESSRFGPHDAIVLAAMNTSEPVLLCIEKAVLWVICQLPKPSGLSSMTLWPVSVCGGGARRRRGGAAFLIALPATSMSPDIGFAPAAEIAAARGLDRRIVGGVPLAPATAEIIGPLVRAARALVLLFDIHADDLAHAVAQVLLEDRGVIEARARLAAVAP